MHAIGNNNNNNNKAECSEAERSGVAIVATKRRISRLIVAHCIKENNYREAAEVVSGMSAVFIAYSRQIQDILGLARKAAVDVSFTVGLLPIIETAKAEILYHREWANEVLAKLPEAESSAPLRAAFKQAGAARTELLNEVMAAYDSLFEARDEEGINDE